MLKFEVGSMIRYHFMHLFYETLSLYEYPCVPVWYLWYTLLPCNHLQQIFQLAHLYL